MVARLEEAFCRLAQAEHAVAVSNGTVALVAALQALQLEPGDEVVTSPFTFVATLNAALEAGAHVRFADISLDDFNVDADAVSAAIGSRTKVLMPVHLYGQMADCIAISELADRRGIALVEDAAQAHGATQSGRAAGSFGIGCFSLYATKNVTSGEGGIITTSDAAIADRLRVLRNQGMRARYQYEMAGHNYRLTDLQAAVAVPQLDCLDETIARRQANAAILTDGLSGLEGLVPPSVSPERSHVFHQYTVRVTNDARIDRDAVAAGLAERGIGSGVYYPRTVADYDCYRDDPRIEISETPNADRAAREALSLPVHVGLMASDLDRIVLETRDLLS